jgi:hypothetical protein
MSECELLSAKPNQCLSRSEGLSGDDDHDYRQRSTRCQLRVAVLRRFHPW